MSSSYRNAAAELERAYDLWRTAVHETAARVCRHALQRAGVSAPPPVVPAAAFSAGGLRRARPRRLSPGGESGHLVVPAGPVLRAVGEPAEEMALSGTHAEMGEGCQFVPNFALSSRRRSVVVAWSSQSRTGSVIRVRSGQWDQAPGLVTSSGTREAGSKIVPVCRPKARGKDLTGSECSSRIEV